MLPIFRTDRAESDFESILEYLAAHSPVAARRVTAAVAERCQLLQRFPALGRSREELGAGVRSLVVEKYIIFYRVAPDSIRILRILHGARNIEASMIAEESS